MAAAPLDEFHRLARQSRSNQRGCVMRYALSVVVVMLVGLAAQIGHAQTDCTSPTQCASAFCVDGVCCNTACDGPLEQCNLPGERGTCVSAAAHCEAARCAVQAALDQDCPC